jgi:hypothetical protein
MSDDSFHEVADQLRATADMKKRAVIAGLIHTPIEVDGMEQSCESCIYFLPRSFWCDLPELNIPVDPEWYCKLWRV